MAANATADQTEPYFSITTWLQTHPKSRCQRRYAQPVPLTSGWTATDNAYSHNDASGLAPLQLPPPTEIPVDLNQWNNERYIPKPDTHAGVELLICEAFTASNSNDPNNNKASIFNDCDIITFRNNLNKILGTIIDPKNEWKVDACFINTTLFLDIVKEQNYDAFSSTPEGQKFDRWGRAFEAACTGQHIADATKEYGMLLKTKIDDIKVFMGAEMDAIDPPSTASSTNGINNTSNTTANDANTTTETTTTTSSGGIPSLSYFVELKTYKPPTHPGQTRTLHRFKHPKWWLQSFLGGVPRLVLGGRDDNGLVQSIHIVNTADLPRISRSNGADWDANQILAFGSDCLKWMMGVGRERCGEQVRFVYDATLRQVVWDVVEEGGLVGRVMECLEG